MRTQEVSVQGGVPYFSWGRGASPRPLRIASIPREDWDRQVFKALLFIEHQL